jgi:hypothetical protein
LPQAAKWNNLDEAEMKLISILLSLIGIVVGLRIFFNPSRVIEIQRKFYEKINWRIEPVSMSKEILNTKIMGLFLFAVSVITLVFILVRH